MENQGTRHAIVDKNGTVVNVVVWEGSEWLPPRNHIVVQHDDANIGDTYDLDTNTLTKNVVIASDDENPPITE